MKTPNFLYRLYVFFYRNAFLNFLIWSENVEKINKIIFLDQIKENQTINAILQFENSCRGIT